MELPLNKILKFDFENRKRCISFVQIIFNTISVREEYEKT